MIVNFEKNNTLLEKEYRFSNFKELRSFPPEKFVLSTQTESSKPLNHNHVQAAGEPRDRFCLGRQSRLAPPLWQNIHFSATLNLDYLTKLKII